jgi:AraC family transcriptional regulator of arabinose operon
MPDSILTAGPPWPALLMQEVAHLAHIRFTSPPTYWRCEPAWSWHARPLTDHLLWYVIDGLGHVTLADARAELAPGSCAVFAPGDAPIAGHDRRRRLLVFGMHFNADSADPVLPQRWVRMHDQALVAALARRCDSSYRHGDSLGMRQSLLCLDQILCLAQEDAARPTPDPIDAAVDKVAAAMRQDPSRRWTVPELARQANLSPAQFTRRFAARHGVSPGRYLINARVDRARHLLIETNMSVTQVATTLGYADVAYFSRQYMRHAGRTPSSIRHP